MSQNPSKECGDVGCPSSCAGLAALGPERVSNDVQGLGGGLERFGGSGLWNCGGSEQMCETSGGFGGSLGGRLVWHVSKP